MSTRSQSTDETDNEMDTQATIRMGKAGQSFVIRARKSISQITMNDKPASESPEVVTSKGIGSTALLGSFLCYVDAPWAYFTTQKLSEQWGDDWNDAPYEHNAGTPYDYSDHDKNEGRAPWEIIKVAYDGDFDTPSKGLCNSPWSVEQINAGAVAWLRTNRYRSGKPVIIPAGVTLARFCELIRDGGGSVFMPNTPAHPPKVG